MDLGQVFTNKSVARYMASLLVNKRDGILLDPCFGSGVFIEASVTQGFSNIVGYELDETLFDCVRKKYPNMILNNQDFLKAPTNKKFDAIIMNPPYIRHEKIDDLKSLGITKKNIRKDPIYSMLPGTANMYMYFLIKAIDLLKDNGELVVIFPCSWLNTKGGEGFKQLLFEKCSLLKQVTVSGEAFEREALVEVVILHIIKSKEPVVAKYIHMNIVGGTMSERLVVDEKIELSFAYSFEKIGSVRRGITTGYNDFFVNPLVKSSAYMADIISSPKSVFGYTSSSAELDKVLVIEKYAQLDKETHNYVRAWKKKILAEKKPKTLFEKISNGNENWYCLNNSDCEGILFSYFVRNDMKFVSHDGKALVRDNFYIISSKVDKMFMFALLNNYYTYFQLEKSGKKYGAGLLKVQRYDIENLVFPNIDEFSSEDISKLQELAKSLINTSNTELIDEITTIISKYSSVSNDTIKGMYLSAKRSRLEQI